MPKVPNMVLIFVIRLVILQNVDGVIESFKIMTEEKCTKIAKYAFDFAVKHGRKKVTAVHKANIM